MARARDSASRPPTRIPSFQQKSGTQKQGPIAALVMLQQEQQQSMNKLIQTMQKAQV